MPGLKKRFHRTLRCGTWGVLVKGMAPSLLYLKLLLHLAQKLHVVYAADGIQETRAEEEFDVEEGVVDPQREAMKQQLLADLQNLHRESFDKTFRGVLSQPREDLHRGDEDEDVTEDVKRSLYRFAWSHTVRDVVSTASSSAAEVGSATTGAAAATKQNNNGVAGLDDETASAAQSPPLLHAAAPASENCGQLHSFLLGELAKTEATVFDNQNAEVKGFETIAWLLEMSEDRWQGRMRVDGLSKGLAGGVGDSIESRSALVVPDYSVLFGPARQIVDAVSRFLHLFSYAIMVFSSCFASKIRNLLHSVFRYWRTAWMSFLDLQFWMVDLGLFSNSNSPKKHFSAVLKVVEASRKVVEELLNALGSSGDDEGDEDDGGGGSSAAGDGAAAGRGATSNTLIASDARFWGHDEEKGMFTNTTLLYRDLFPETALIDKGVLRVVLRQLGFRQVVDAGSSAHKNSGSGAVPPVAKIFDFGAMDGGYARWLNDTGLFEAHAVEGSPNVDKISSNVHFGDLTKDLRDQLPEYLLLQDLDTAPASYVLCIEVAEHIPPGEKADAFLANLQRFARTGLIISWAPPWVLGEGHVNTMTFEESRAKIEPLGFRMNAEITEALRAASQLSWVKESVAYYDAVAAADVDEGTATASGAGEL